MLQVQLPEKDQEPVVLEETKPTTKTPFWSKKARAETARNKAVVALWARLGVDRSWDPKTMEGFAHCIFCEKMDVMPDVTKGEETFVCRVCMVTLTVTDTS